MPPFVIHGPGGLDGFAFRLYEQVVRQAGLTVNLQLVPFARAVAMLESGQAEAALVFSRSPERETHYRWLYPVGRFRFAAFSLPGALPPPAEAAHLSRQRIGVLRASIAKAWLEREGVKRIVEGKDYTELRALLERGIVEAVVAPETVLRSGETRAGGEGMRVTIMNKGYEFYTVASPSMSDDTVRRLRSAYQQLLHAGVVAQLRKAHPETLAPG